jgi:hypothetical protein
VTDTHIHFWLDPIPTSYNGKKLFRGVANTPTALIHWLRHNRNLSVSAPVTRRIAGGLAARSVNLNVKSSAPRADRGCPDPCISYFHFQGHNYDFGYGTDHATLVRLYFAPLKQGNARRTLTVAIDTTSRKAYKVATRLAKSILSSLKLPAKVTTG